MCKRTKIKLLTEDLEKTLRFAITHIHDKEMEHEEIILAHVVNKSLQWDVRDKNYGLILTLNYIFENMSERLARALAKRVNCDCTGESDKIEHLAIDVLNTIINLYNCGEIYEPQMTEFAKRCNEPVYPGIIPVK